MSSPVAWSGASTAEALESNDPWDRMTILGVDVPGIVQVSGAIARKLDVKKAAGSDGAKVAHLGAEPARFEITVMLWTASQLEVWDTIAWGLRNANQGGVPAAVDVSHPALSMSGITKAIAERIGFPQRRDHGVFEVRVTMVESRQPQPVSKSGTTEFTGSLSRSTVLGPAPETTRAAKDPARDASATAP
jgi:hypothetical protein